MTAHLRQEPDDLRALLLQAYILSFGLQDDARACLVYRQVIHQAAGQEPYCELAEEGLRQCGATGPSPAAAVEMSVIPVLPPGDGDATERLPATPWLAEGPRLEPAPEELPALVVAPGPPSPPERLDVPPDALEVPLPAGWLVVDLRG